MDNTETYIDEVTGERKIVNLGLQNFFKNYLSTEYSGDISRWLNNNAQLPRAGIQRRRAELQQQQQIRATRYADY